MTPGERYDARVREIWAGIDRELSTRQAWDLAREPMRQAQEECERALKREAGAGPATAMASPLGDLYAALVADEDLSDEERAELAAAMGRYIKAGIARRKAEGKQVGPAPRLTDEQAAEVRTLKEDGISVPELVKRFGVSRATIYRALKDDH